MAIHPEQTVSQKKAQEILAALRAKESNIRNLKGLFQASIAGSILPISKTLPGVVFYTRPNSIRLKGFTPVGGTFFQFLREGDVYRLMMPASGRLTTGNIQELGRAGDIGRVVELSLRAIDAVLGIISGANLATMDVYEEEEGFRLDIPASTDQRIEESDVTLTRYWVEKQRYDIVRVEYKNQEHETLMSIACRDFRMFSTSSELSEATMYLPFHLKAEDDRLSGSVTLLFQELAINEES
ncbi:MAG: hypothetical protein NPIRA02_12980 [Nitrospirales bacterium]|nr:MAG: hypothetical protein NPIRA02_12980 [Nitrospirales bacterium]